MASRGLEMGMVLVLVAMLWGGAKAQSSCTSAIVSLAPCLNFITGNSSTPSPSCCSQLNNVVQSSPQCLCSVLNGNLPPIGINVNQTLALSLPGACQMQSPISQCKAANGPAASPASSPASSPELSPASSPTDSSSTETPKPDITPSASVVPSGNGGSAGTGSKTVPTTAAGTSDGSITKAPFNLVLFLLFTASCASAIINF